MSMLPTDASLAADLDVGALKYWLAPRMEGIDGPVELIPLTGGRSNPTYLMRCAGRRWVLRSKPGPASLLLPSAHAIEREFLVLAALHGSEVPVPRALLLCEDESVVGRAFYVMEHIEGRGFWDPALPDLARAERPVLYEEMNRVVAAIHAVDLPSTGLYAYSRTGQYLQRQIARWTRQLEGSGPTVGASMHYLSDWLPAHLPRQSGDQPEAVALVHGDLRIDNLLWHPTESRVLAVLDWELSTLGDPLADLAYHLLSWHIPPHVFRGMGGLDLAALGIPQESDYLRRYAARRGLADLDCITRDWPFYLAFNLFRLAAIAFGVAQRAAQAGERAAENDRATALALAELGRRTTDHRFQ
jgi:aminoglycoside phosphotransferase (APT) family kinase protein